MRLLEEPKHRKVFKVGVSYLVVAWLIAQAASIGFPTFDHRIKAQSVYVADSGFACHLRGIETAAEFEKFPFLGTLFEGFIAGEIVKAQSNAGRRRERYYFRDQQGLEVDFVVPGKEGTLRLVEAKAARAVTPNDAAPMQRLAATWKKGPGAWGRVEQLLVHRPARAAGASSSVASGVEAWPWLEFVKNVLT